METLRKFLIKGSSFPSPSDRFLDFINRGGLADFPPAKGSSTIERAFSYLNAHPDSDAFYLWISNEGTLYPEALHHTFPIPLQRLLLVTVKDSSDVWKVALEAIHTGLFGWAFLRPSQGCAPAYLRKLQLTAEHSKTRVCILCKTKLPHWMFKTQVTYPSNAAG